MSAHATSSALSSGSSSSSSSAAAAAAAAIGSGSKRSFPADADERRVQPRQHRDRANAAAAAANTSTSGSQSDAAAAADHPPPAACLYRHPLESVLTFLNQRELVAALQVSRGWLAAVGTMASLQLTLEQPSAALLGVVADSAMGRHVTQLGLEGQRVALTADSLHFLAGRMSHLRVLFGELRLTPTDGPLTFPFGLQRLHLDAYRTAIADVNAALQAISRLPLLESLTVHMRSIDNQLSFAPLLSLPRLREFVVLEPCIEIEWTDAQVAELRALTHLRRLTVEYMRASQLRRLLVQPHGLQWQQLTLHDLVDESAALLLQLPSLTTIVERILGSHFEWLRRLPNLTHVDLHALHGDDELDDEVDVASLVAALQCCTEIESLRLTCRGLLAAHLAELLPRLPRLQMLGLVQTDIASLSFLAQEPMVQQLCALTLSSCTKLPLAELRHLHALKGLQSLEIRDPFTTPMDGYSQWLLTPPSVALPQLKQFVFSVAP